MHRLILAASLMVCANTIYAAPTPRQATAGPTLRQAVDAAWLRHPAAQAREARSAQFDAQKSAAASWLADAPSVALGQKTDRWNRNAGAREIEAELELPINLPAQRRARMGAADQEALRFDAAFAAEKLKVAGEVREAWWAARLAQNDLALAKRKAQDARDLAGEVQKRFDAGDVARTDWNQAEAAARQAEGAEASAVSVAFRALRTFTALTGLAALPEQSESAEPARQTDLANHPALLAATKEVDLTRARRDAATADRSDPPVVSFGTGRERAAFGESSDTSLMLRLTVPLPTSARNAPRVAAANAEHVEAEARLRQARLSLEAECDAAQAELDASARQASLADKRAALARETQELIARAWHLGEIDLATRLRAEAERFDADLSLSRAQLEQGRALSRLHQATGRFP
jgi:cobalt-zinc-cadmium efflux system outer membrane protein